MLFWVYISVDSDSFRTVGILVLPVELNDIGIPYRKKEIGRNTEKKNYPRFTLIELIYGKTVVKKHPDKTYKESRQTDLNLPGFSVIRDAEGGEDPPDPPVIFCFWILYCLSAWKRDRWRIVLLL